MMVGHRDKLISSLINDKFDYEDQIKIHFPAKNGKRLMFWRKFKYQLTDYHSLPAFLRDNEYILGYYRSEWPLSQVLLSIFTIHNETLNVWTHLIGFFIFLFLTIYTTMKVPSAVDLQSLPNIPDILKKADLHSMVSRCMSSLSNMPAFIRDELKTSQHSMDSLSGSHLLELLTNCLPDGFSFASASQINELLLQDVKEELGNAIAPLSNNQPITRWPFFAFMGGTMFCLLASSTCHLLSCHSEHLSYIMLRLDYAGIAALIATSFYPPVYYSFMCYPFFLNLYLIFITTIGVATIIFSLSPVFQTPKYRSIRAALFFGMGVSGVAPILHKLVLHWNEPEALQTTGYEVLMGTLYGIGALIYATRIPERWKPGKFDIAGHSHQLFHILVVAAAYTHYHAGLVYLKWRDVCGCDHHVGH